MKKQLFCFSILVLVSIVLTPPFSWCALPVVPKTDHRVSNPAIARDGYQVLHPDEIWRTGGVDEDFLFGFVITATIDSEDNTYLLDRWLGAVSVLGPDGEFVTQLSREGEGPGETIQPTDLTWLPDGDLGITQPLPGRLVRIDRQGNPVGDIVPSGVSAQSAQFGILTETDWRGGTLAYCGGQTDFREGRMEVSNFLAICDLKTGAELSRILDKQSTDDGFREIREFDQYWVHEGRWCLGPEGNIYTAPSRDVYAIRVYSPEGHLEKIIERDYKPRHRTKEEISILRKQSIQPENEWGGGRERKISADEPCISELRVADNGELWVRHSLSSHDQTPGVFATWDVFDANGTYVRAVSIVVTGDPDNDRLLFLSDERLLMIRGFNQASDAMWGPGEESEGEIVGEIVLYGVTL